MTDMNTRLLSTLGAICGTTVACFAPSETTPTTERSTYGEISLPPESQRFGSDLEQIALAAFGASEIPSEGNFNQEVTVVE